MRKFLFRSLGFLLVLMLCAGTCIAAQGETVAVPILQLRAGGGDGGTGGTGGSGGGNNGDGNTGPYYTTDDEGIGAGSLPEIGLLTGLLALIGGGITVAYRRKFVKREKHVKKQMESFAKKDGAWDVNKLTQQVKDTYFAVQKAWSEGNMEPARPYMSAALYESFNTKLAWMAHRNEQNVLKKIKLLEAVPQSAFDHEDSAMDHVWFLIRGSMIDYTVNRYTNERLSGNPFPASFCEYWQFTRNEERRWVLNAILQENEAEQITFEE